MHSCLHIYIATQRAIKSSADPATEWTGDATTNAPVYADITGIQQVAIWLMSVEHSLRHVEWYRVLLLLDQWPPYLLLNRFNNVVSEQAHAEVALVLNTKW